MNKTMIMGNIQYVYGLILGYLAGHGVLLCNKGSLGITYKEADLLVFWKTLTF